MFWSLYPLKQPKTIIFLKINLLKNQHFQKQFLFLALFLGVWTAKKQSKMSPPDSKQNSKFGKAVISGCIFFVFLACTEREDGREYTKELKIIAILMNFIFWISKALFFVENHEKASFIESAWCWGAPSLLSGASVEVRHKNRNSTHGVYDPKQGSAKGRVPGSILNFSPGWKFPGRVARLVAKPGSKIYGP